MTSFFVQFANITTLYSVLLGLFSLLMYFKSGRIARVFCLYLGVAGSIDLVSFSFAQSVINNLVFFHLFTFMELGLLGLFFSLLFKRLEVPFDIMGFLYASLVLVFLNSLFVQSLDSYSTYSSTAVSIAIIAGCIFTFFKILDKGTDHHSKVTRWLLSGLFLYHMGSVVVLLTADLLMKVDSEVQIVIWIIRTFIILLAKILFTIGLLGEVNYQKQHLGYG